MIEALRRAADRLRAWSATASGRTWSRRLRALALLGVGVFLVYQISQIGLARVLESLPSSPWFYLAAAASWVALPASEVLIYRRLWGGPRGELFEACARKRAFNDDVMGYAGEAMLTVWATGRGIDGREALRAVRDNNIVSAAVSTAATLAAVAAAVAIGAVGGRESLRYAAFAAIPLVLLVAALILFGRHLFAMPARLAAYVALVHFGRLVATSALSMLAWSVAVPSISWRTWLAFLAVQLLVSRAPAVPGRDFLFVGAGVQLASALQVAEAGVAGALLVQVVLYKVLNLASVVASWRSARAVPVSTVSEEPTSRSRTPTY